MVSTEAPIRAGLIFQQRQSADQLKRALREAGIDLAVELDVEALRAGQLDQQDVEVYIVNLESELEDLLDEVTELLDATDRPVVYNDAGVSSDLSGWDQARWARHLSAKIRKGRDLLPPAPLGAQAIPMPARVEPAVAEAEPGTGSASAVPVVEAVEDAGQGQAAVLPELEMAGAGDLADAAADAGARGADDAQALDQAPLEFDLGEEMVSFEEVAEFTPVGSGPGEPVSAFSETLALSETDFGLTDEFAAILDAEPPGSPDADSSSSSAAVLTESAAEDSAILDWTIDLEPGEDVAAEQPTTTVTEPSDTLADLADLDADLELGLDLPAELYQEDQLEAIGNDGDPDAALLDDLSAFDVIGEDSSDLLEVLDAPAGSGGEAFDASDLDALFDDAAETLVEGGLEASEAPITPASVTLESTVDALEELDTLAIFDESPAAPAAESSVQVEGFADLDELLGDSGSAAESAPPRPADAPSTGFSLPDLSEWVLEPLEEEPGSAQSEPLASFKPESTGLDLRDLDSVKPKLQVAAESAAPAKFEPTPPPESLDTELPDLDLGIDFVDLDLAPDAVSDSPAASPPLAAEAEPAAVAADTEGPRRVVILGASIGGPDSIRAFLKDIKPDLRAAFILVQHMGAEFLDLMAQQLDRVSPLRVHLASHGRSLNEGEVLIAPVGKRLKVNDRGAVDLTEEAGATAYSPSIDQVLADSLQRWGASRLLVIIFSGMANDAVAGSRQLAAAGVPIWAQDPASCVISSMVDGVVAAKVVSFIGTPEQLAAQANRLLA